MIIGSVCENKASEKEFQLPENVKKFVSNGLKYTLRKVMALISILMIKDFRKWCQVFSNKEKI